MAPDDQSRNDQKKWSRPFDQKNEIMVFQVHNMDDFYGEALYFQTTGPRFPWGMTRNPPFLAPGGAALQGWNVLHIPNGDVHDAAVYEKAVAEAGKFGHKKTRWFEQQETHKEMGSNHQNKLTKKSIKITNKLRNQRSEKWRIRLLVGMSRRGR